MTKFPEPKFPKPKLPKSSLPASLSIALWLVGALWAVAIAAHLFHAPREIVHAAFAFGLAAGLVEWWSLRRGSK
jgi:hypothetical protein